MIKEEAEVLYGWSGTDPAEKVLEGMPGKHSEGEQCS